MALPPSAPEPVDEGGWLGPAVAVRPDPVESATSGGPAYPTRRFEERDLVARTGPRPGLLLGLVLAGVVAIAATAVISLAPGRSNPPAPPPSAGPTTPMATAGGAPRDVRLTDHGTTIVLSWTDPSAGTAAFLIVGTGPGGRSLPPKQLPQGTTSATFDGLGTTGSYCFRIGALYAFNQVETAKQVCTARG
jgi:hypothetical protein